MSTSQSDYYHLENDSQPKEYSERNRREIKNNFKELILQYNIP